MNISNTTKSFMSICLLSFLFIFTVFNFIEISQAVPNGDSLPIEINSLQMKKISQIQGRTENVTSIDINLPTYDWNLTSIELNFSNIRLERQILTIEEEENGYDKVYNKNGIFNNLALFNQLEITEETTIYGIYIKGFNTTSIKNITFQIQGYNSILNKPDGIIKASIPLNISDSLDWYLQDFSSSPIILQENNYSLIINGTEKNDFPVDSSKYIAWITGDENLPTTPNLYSGGHDYYGWLEPQINKTYLQKIVQKTNTPYNPQDINMSASYKGNLYIISNNFGPGGGNLTFKPNEILLSNKIEIQINNNQSVLLNFTVEYSANLQKVSNVQSTLLIKESMDNYWSIEFTTNKTFFNYYSLEIDYSVFNWYDITIYKEDNNITSPLILDEIYKKITLPNITIDKDLINWRIEAYSPKVVLNLNFPSVLLTLEPGQDLKFSVNVPQGNLTFFLIDSTGLGEYSDTIEDISGDYIFDFTIPNNAYAGEWKIYTYWNNNSHAGVISQEFDVFVPFRIDPQVIINILITIAIILIVIISTYQTLKITKKHYDDKKARLLNTVSDILNLKYFMIAEKSTGLNIYDKKIGKGRKDAMLISGYLDAISKFEIALTNSEKRSQSIKLEYQKSKILMSEFKTFRIILIMKTNPSNYILNSIEKLSYDIDKQYGEYFSNFTGDMSKFRGIEQLIENDLHISLVYPYKIDYKKIEELSKRERLMIQRATNILQSSPHFYILFLIPENRWKYRNFKTILKLIEKKVFYPIKIIENTLE